MGPPGLPRGLSRGLVLTFDEAREREVLAASFTISRWYCTSCCLASEPRLGRVCELKGRGLRGEGGPGLEPRGGKFAG